MKNLVVTFLIGFVMALLTSCSHKPVYEKMSVAYIVHLDMKHEASKKPMTAQNIPDVRDANMDLMDQLVNKEIKMQFDEIPNE